MKRFAELFSALDRTRRTSKKEAALVGYFSEAAPQDAAWALYYLLGKKMKRLVPTSKLREWTAEVSGHPLWLVEESYDAVGDLAETSALLVEDLAEHAAAEERSLSSWIEDRLQPLAKMNDEEKREVVVRSWSELALPERFLFNKLITGGFRVGVAKALVVRALARVAGDMDRAVMAHRLTGRWKPSAEYFESLLSASDDSSDPLRPYPFCLAHPLDRQVEELGEIEDWRAEWKWDGIRAQIVKRAGEVLIWSRGEELVTDSFPEVRELARALPDGTVLDGELLAWSPDEDTPLPFLDLQQRIRRKTVSRKMLDEIPARFLAYDLLEDGGSDLRAEPLEQRRDALRTLATKTDFGVSEDVEAASWQGLAELRETCRARGVEGLMLKRRDSSYGSGRQRSSGWYKWKVDPFELDVVLMYAQRGHGRRASLYTDYTLGVWSEDSLVPIAKAYSGLTDAEIRRVDQYCRRHITDRFGPVRVVEPKLVFQIAFEGLQHSSRHKSGIALRFPRIAKWREDKEPHEADTLESVRALMSLPAERNGEASEADS